MALVDLYVHACYMCILLSICSQSWSLWLFKSTKHLLTVLVLMAFQIEVDNCGQQSLARLWSIKRFARLTGGLERRPCSSDVAEGLLQSNVSLKLHFVFASVLRPSEV